MRNIDRYVVTAVNNRFNYKSGNTRVEVVNNEGVKNVFVYLHGNLIYQIVNNVASFSLAGRNTPQTRSRLNALGVDVKQRNFQAVFNGKAINANTWYYLE